MKRDLFANSQGIYLLNHSVGLMPKSTEHIVDEKYLQPWHESPDAVWSHWLNEIEQFRIVIAKLIHAEPRDICPQANLSSALTKIFSSLPKQKRKSRVLLSADDFPSLGYVTEKMNCGNYDIRYIPSGSDLHDLSLWESYLTAEVHVVLLTHVQSNTGHRLPIEDITALTKAKSIYSIVDVAQSAGVIPVDTRDWRADFIIGSCVKWLCGGPGAGFLWIKPQLTEQLQPTDVGWFSHKAPFEFDIFNFQYADDALRFWGGTPSVVPYIIATNSVNLLLDIGVEAIHQHNARCKQFIIENLPETLLISPLEMTKQGGTLVISDKTNIAPALKQRNILFDQRQQGLRLSPHIYNSLEELEPIKNIVNSI